MHEEDYWPKTPRETFERDYKMTSYASHEKLLLHNELLCHRPEVGVGPGTNRLLRWR